MPAAWGIEEQGKLWPNAYERVSDAMRDLADRVCELSNMDDKAKGQSMEWTLRVVRVSVEKQSS
jgi:uncharacterized protein with PhoU and TrkA domain